MSKQALVYARIVKIDEVKREVSGVITSQALDKANEVMDYETSKPYFEKWSESISKATGGKSLGNVRAMHRPVAAGKLTELEFMDDVEQIFVTAKVVDDDEWLKVDEGVYTGFSIGGSYIKRWTDPENKSVKRFTVNPAEVSLVDNPCNPDCHFTAVKADGTTEERAFKIKETSMDYEPTNEEVAARATQMSEDAGDATKTWTDFLEPAREALKAEHAAAEDEPEGHQGEPVEEPHAGAEGSEDDPEKAASSGKKPKPGKKPADAPKPDPNSQDDPNADEDKGEKNPPSDKDKKQGKAAGVSEEDYVRISETSLEQVWKTPDGQTFTKKEEAVAHVAKSETPEEDDPVKAALAQAKKVINGEPATVESKRPTELVPGLTKAFELFDQVHKFYEDRREELVTKGIYTVSSLASILSSLRWICDDSICEAAYEKDGSPVPGQLMDGLRTLGAALVSMAQEEVSEMIADLQNMGVKVEVLEVDDDALVVELSADADGLIKMSPTMVEKVGARNSNKDQSRVQKMHDTSVELGAMCDGAGKLIATDEDLQKVAETNPVVKALLDERAENKQQLEKQAGQITEAVEGIGELTKTIGTMREEMEKLKNEPTPMAPRTIVVNKGAEVVISGEGPVTTEDAQKAVALLMSTPEGRDKLAEAAIRASQQNGHTV